MIREIAILRAAIKEKTARGIYALEKYSRDPAQFKRKIYIFKKQKKKEKKRKTPKQKKDF